MTTFYEMRDTPCGTLALRDAAHNRTTRGAVRGWRWNQQHLHAPAAPGHCVMRAKPRVELGMQPEPRTVLCLGAHCDDIEIGCGGTLQRWRAAYPQVRFHCAVFSSEGERRGETEAALARLLSPGEFTLEVHSFRGSYFPRHWAEIKDRFEMLKANLDPDVILTHRLEDRHQDHRVLAELTWNTFRDHLILEYEIPKYDGDLGQPNLYVPLPEAMVNRKIGALLESFPTQRTRSWFTADTFRGLMRLRGVECNAPSGFAEAFHARKLTF